MSREDTLGKISVLMGVYNCEKTVEEAIDSIQKQTYSNWELIVCDDGSTDNTFSVVKRKAGQDKRIKLLSNNINRGLNVTLNRCLRNATGEYVARMDGDDLCDSQRFEKQLEAFSLHPDVAIISSAMKYFDESGVWGRNHVKTFPTAKDVVVGSPICHAPVMIKRDAIVSVGGYTEDLRMLRVEDVNLWIKLYAAGYRCYNIDEPLYYMRNDQNALNRRKYKYRINSTYVRLNGCKMLHLGIDCYFRAFLPMMKGLIPAKLRFVLKKWRS